MPLKCPSESEASEPLRVAVCIDTREGPARDRLAAIYKHAARRNWRLTLVRHDDSAHVRGLGAAGFHGAILFDRSDRLIAELHRRKIPCVEASAARVGQVEGSVFVDDEEIGRRAAEHLARAGFESFAYGGPAGAAVSEKRRESFGVSAAACGNFVGAFADRHGEGEAGLDRLVRWLRTLSRPTGLLCFDDKMALRVLAACTQAGLRIPGEIGVLGIGNDELLCELAQPGLSSVAVPTHEIGRVAADLLDGILRGGARAAGGAIALPPLDVVVRTSTDRLPSGDPLITAAIQFLHENAQRPIGTDQVAAAVRVPRRTLERRFSAATGRTLHGFVTELRVRKAKQILRQFDLSLVEIAQMCGYSGVSAFVRMFTHEVGCHPHAYRSAHYKR
jgi:LacI family transcriptional regulator